MREPKRAAATSIAEIKALIRSGAVISTARLCEWMESEDLETIGAFFTVLTEHREQLDSEAQAMFGALPARLLNRVLHYFRCCLIENPRGKYAHARDRAANALCDWMRFLWASDPVPAKGLDDIKGMLAELYHSGDNVLRSCIVNSCLEYLFESRRAAAYFADWTEDPVLATAYNDALEWGRGFWP